MPDAALWLIAVSVVAFVLLSVAGYRLLTSVLSEVNGEQTAGETDGDGEGGHTDGAGGPA